MSKTHHRRRRKPHFQRRTGPGAPPGMVVVDPAAPKPVVRLIAYGPREFEELAVENTAAVSEFLERAPVTWVNVAGLGDAQVIHEMGRLFRLHPLALEDVVNLHQRAKVEQYGGHLFVVARMARENSVCDTEQVSLFLGPNFVLTFNMPELSWRYGYAYALGLMAAATAAMLCFFHHKGWLLPQTPQPYDGPARSGADLPTSPRGK